MRTILFAAMLFLITVDVHSQEWKKNIDEALRIASQSNKKVLVLFTVAENCDNCHALEQQIFKSPEFVAFAEANYILVRLDFSQDQNDLSPEIVEKNLLIVEKYNKDGFFPLVVVLNTSAKVLGKIGVYKDETPKQFINMLQSLGKV